MPVYNPAMTRATPIAAVSAEDLFYTGTHLLGEGEPLAAAAVFRQALRIAPEMAEAHANLGWILEQQKRAQEAETCYRQALALDPQQVQTLINFGAFLVTQKRLDEAEAVYLHARKMAPESPGVLSNLGMLLACLQREEEAEAAYRLAIGLDPAYRKARFNLAYLLLRQGRYQEGWACMEAREWNAVFERQLDFPRWQGEPLAGKSLLIAVEGGFGDMIQFCRYAQLAKESGAAHVAILCHPELKSLLGSAPAIDDVIGYDESLPAMAWDYWTMPLSLPRLFGTTSETVPAALPYLSAAPARMQYFQQLVEEAAAKSRDPHLQDGASSKAGRPLRVGLAWQGNPLFENDADRSLPTPDLLAPLFALSHVQYFSLQKNAGPVATTPASTGVYDLAPHLDDFADTAACVMHLDLVITVDTAVAHLTGALGKPCWVLLPAYKPDWRWLAGRDDTPWYPGVMRLFTQQHAGEWAPVIARVGSSLRALTQQQNENDNNN